MSGTRSNRWVQIAILAALFVITGRLGQLLAIPPGLATPIWLPSGITVAAFIVVGRKLWPGVVLGAIAISSLQLSRSVGLGGLAMAVSVSVGIAGAVLTEPLLAEIGYRRWRGTGSLLSQPRNVTALLLWSAPLGCVCAATAASLLLVLSGATPWERLGETWTTWMIGDLAGIYMLAPALLTFAQGDSAPLPDRDRPAVILALLALVGVSAVAFFGPWSTHASLAFLPVPLVVYIAYRFNDRIASLVGPAVAVAALVAAASGQGMLGSSNTSLIVLQIFVLVGIMTALLTRAMVNQRNAVEREARRLMAELAHLSRVTMMGELAAGMAHEYHQPLTAIANYASASLIKLRRHEDALRDVRQPLERISEEALRAGKIVARLRAFLQKREPRRTPCDINEIATEAIRLTEMAHAFPHVTIEYQPNPSLPRPCVDQVQITQVVANLILNACEAITSSGAARGLVRVTVEADTPGRLNILVTDDGPGMDAPTARSCFEPFFSTKEGGLGIGLGIGRALAQAHGGELRLSRTSPRGTCFCLELPLQPEDAESTENGDANPARDALGR